MPEAVVEVTSPAIARALLLIGKASEALPPFSEKHTHPPAGALLRR
jgi:hypothetical protein